MLEVGVAWQHGGGCDDGEVGVNGCGDSGSGVGGGEERPSYIFYHLLPFGSFMESWIGVARRSGLVTDYQT